jgi:hypothetical protein
MRNYDCLLRSEVLTATSMKMAVFWDVAPCSLVDTDRRFRGAYCLHHQGLITLMMDAVSSSETLVNIYQTTRSNFSEDSHLYKCLFLFVGPCVSAPKEFYGSRRNLVLEVYTAKCREKNDSFAPVIYTKEISNVNSRPYCISGAQGHICIQSDSELLYNT